MYLCTRKTQQDMTSRLLFRRWTVVLVAVLAAVSVQAQPQARVLFIGNSYTEVNNLPQMTADIARSMGAELSCTSHTPGGCTFSQHCTNESMELIRRGGWDVVVLQEQSQYPSFPQSQVEAEVFPFAQRLVDSVYAASPCAEPMFYMTWGRKNGDARNARYFPVLGTYEGMDSMLYERYMYMAEANDASVCPVGRVWRYLRERHPEIELYQSDESHPSVEGTYAAACSFYVMLFGGDPETITYFPEEVVPEVAETIRQAVHEVVYNAQERWHRQPPRVEIEVLRVRDLMVTIAAHTAMADSVTWDFGDGFQSRESTAEGDSVMIYCYEDSGTYEVMLVASRHCMTDTARVTISVSTDTTVGIVGAQCAAANALTIFPNPAATAPAITVDGTVVTPANAEITVITPTGCRVPYRRLYSGELPAGLYFIKVCYRGRTYTGKFVKL